MNQPVRNRTREKRGKDIVAKKERCNYLPEEGTIMSGEKK